MGVGREHPHLIYKATCILFFAGSNAGGSFYHSTWCVSARWVYTMVAIDYSSDGNGSHPLMCQLSPVPGLPYPSLLTVNKHVPRTLSWSLDYPEPFSLLCTFAYVVPLSWNAFPPPQPLSAFKTVVRGHHLQDVFLGSTLFPRPHRQASTCSLIALHVVIAHVQDKGRDSSYLALCPVVSRTGPGSRAQFERA